jgi:putative FmdB family regulatory protein
MPVYEYACTACGERTEARQSFDDPPLEECPVCGGKLRKLYSPVGVVFKGSGFYSTDAKSSSKPSSSSKERSEKPAASSSKESSKESSKDSSSSSTSTPKTTEKSA